MLDLRHHLFYFIAIFLMLGVGILVGASFYGPVQVRQQQTSLAHLRAEVDGAVQDGRNNAALLQKSEAALDNIRPVLVRSKLSGQRIILLQLGDYADAAEETSAALRDAGSSPAATLTFSDRWATLGPDARAAGLVHVAECLTKGTTAPAQAQILQDLETQNLVVLTGSLAVPSNTFVVIGGEHQDGASNAPLMADVIQQLQSGAAPTATVVGCEMYAAEVSSIPVFQQAGISSVDCIDRPLGMLDLPFALKSDPGDDVDYGLKPTASHQTPPSLEAAP